MTSDINFIRFQLISFNSFSSLPPYSDPISVHYPIYTTKKFEENFMKILRLKWKICHLKRMSKIKESNADSSVWDNFMDLVYQGAVPLIDFLDCQNDIMSLLCCSKTTYEVISDVIARKKYADKIWIYDIYWYGKREPISSDYPYGKCKPIVLTLTLKKINKNAEETDEKVKDTDEKVVIQQDKYSEVDEQVRSAMRGRNGFSNDAAIKNMIRKLEVTYERAEQDPSFLESLNENKLFQYNQSKGIKVAPQKKFEYKTTAKQNYDRNRHLNNKHMYR